MPVSHNQNANNRNPKIESFYAKYLHSQFLRFFGLSRFYEARQNA